jgi:hypothetical protein
VSTTYVFRPTSLSMLMSCWLWTPSNQTPIGKNDGSDHPLAAAFGCCA